MKRKMIAAALCLLALLVSGCSGRKQEVRMEQAAASLTENSPDDKYRTSYEIFVYSFCDSNGDGIGDLKGIEEKLDYIGETMGFDQIWTTPVFPSPTYHKYDAADYMAIDPQFGTMEDFDRLLAACHEKGIRWILDLAVNHTSVEHPWFQQAAAYLRELPPDWEPSVEYCPYFDYYHFSREYQNGYAALEGTNWYYEARFWEGMPDLNLDSEAVRAELTDIFRFWLDKGVDGFRLDALTSYYTDDMNASIDFTRWLTETVRSIDPEAYLVGEVWTDQSVYSRYYESGIDSLFDFRFAGDSGVITQVAMGNRSAAKLAQDLRSEEELYRSVSPQAVNAPFYTNHDMARGAGYFGYDKGGRTKLALGLNLMMTGNAFTYYGEEIGMKGSGKDENKRAPMYWSADPTEKGMCSGPPDMDSFDQKFDSVQEQLEDPDSILNYCRAAIRTRKAFPVIARGTTVPQEEWCSDTICAFTREKEGMEPVLVFINTAEEAQTVDLKESPYKQIASVLASASDKAVLKGTKLTVPALGIVVLRQK